MTIYGYNACSYGHIWVHCMLIYPYCRNWMIRPVHHGHQDRGRLRRPIGHACEGGSCITDLCAMPWPPGQG